jgi:hypothetical protein
VQAMGDAPLSSGGSGVSVTGDVLQGLASPGIPAVDNAHQDFGIQERDLQSQERYEDELIMHLERDQFVAETSRVIPRAALSGRAIAGLWALRVFVVLVSLMVVYTFIDQLH